jgi:IS30 family transposase
MGLSRSALPTGVFCDYCQKDTRFLAIHHAIELVNVCRSTIYYWMEHGLIHWRELPSGRRVICQESLTRRARPTVEISAPIKERVQNCPIPSNPVR